MLHAYLDNDLQALLLLEGSQKGLCIPKALKHPADIQPVGIQVGTRQRGDLYNT